MDQENKLYQNVCRIQCGSEQGTAFLVGSDTLLTARHTVVPALLQGAEITAAFEGEVPVSCTLTSPADSGSPIVLLQLPAARKHASLPVSCKTLSYGNSASAIGYFSADDTVSDRIGLEFVRTYDSLEFESNTAFKPVEDRNRSYKGFSGAPIFADGAVIGMLTYEREADHTAVRVRGICGPKFRKLAAELGVQWLEMRSLPEEPHLSSGPVFAGGAFQTTEPDTPARKQFFTQAEAALLSGRFEDGEACIQAAKEVDAVDADLVILEALLSYWKVMSRFFPVEECKGFMLASGFAFSPDVEQRRELEKAYTLLSGLYDRLGDTDRRRGQLAWALMVLCALLPEKDPVLWLDRFRVLCPLDPLDVLFCVERKIAYPRELAEQFLSLSIPDENGGLFAHAKLKLFVSLERFDEARAFFSNYRNVLAAYSSCPPEECELQLALDCRDYSHAWNILKKLPLSMEERERYEIAILYGQDNKAFNSLVKRALALARITKKPLDYYNAAVICRRYKKWKDALTNAKAWWKNTEELVALEAQAEALLRRNDPIKCLKTVETAEEKGCRSLPLRECKLNALLALARFPEARELAETLGGVSANAQLTLMEARSYLTEGDPEKAVGVLQAYADRDQYNLEVYSLLLELLLGKRPDDAYRYAERLFRHAPEDEHVLMLAGNTALMTGHDRSGLATRYLMHLDRMASRGGSVRKASFEEIQELLQQERKRWENLQRLYLNAECPVHMFADPDREPLGGILWNTMESGPVFLGRFGVSKSLNISLDQPLLLDYTSCLLLHKLGLLERLCSAFPAVWLEHHLLEVWYSDINRLATVQRSRKQNAIQLSKALRSLSFTTFFSDEVPPDPLPYAPADYVVLRCAEGTGSFIVAEHPSGSISGEAVPAGWHKLNVQPSELYAALDGMNLPHPAYDPARVRLEIVQKLMPQAGLVLDQQVLSDLLNADALASVCETFRVVLPSEIVTLLHEDAESFNRLESSNQFLTEAYEHVHRLYDQGKLLLQPVEKTTQLEGGNVYAQLICNEMQIASNNPVILVMDDRVLTSYRVVGKKADGPMLSTYDLVMLLHREGLINRADYYQQTDRLLAMNYGFFVPPAGYLFSRLSAASVRDDGILQETGTLRTVRRTVAFAFDKTVGLKDRPMGTCTMPEISGFLLDLVASFRECLSMIWGNGKMPEWRAAASDWLLAFLGEFRCDIGLLNENAEDTLAIKQEYLLLQGFLIKQQDRKREYARWIEPYMLVSWKTTPKLVEKVALLLAKNLQAVRSGNPLFTSQMKQAADILTAQFIRSLPHPIRPVLLAMPSCAPYRPYLKDIAQEDAWWSDAQDDTACEGPTPVFDPDHVLTGGPEAWENALFAVLSSAWQLPDAFLQAFSPTVAHKVAEEENYPAARFLADLAWYAPPGKMATLHEGKHTLSKG